jgi:hypothetical protein
MAWYHDPLYRGNAAAGLEARLYVSQAGRRYHFQTGSEKNGLTGCNKMNYQWFSP